MNNYSIHIIACVFLVMPFVIQANEVSIQFAELEKQNATWRVNVTLSHEDSGWEHYADAWRVVTDEGTVLATRVLHHPHVDEQPFTRSQSGINIPTTSRVIFIEAHDKVHEWSKDRLRIDLQKPHGDRYRIR